MDGLQDETKQVDEDARQQAPQRDDQDEASQAQVSAAAAAKAGRCWVLHQCETIMTYEEMKTAAQEAGLVVKEKPLQSSNGRINGNKIAILKDLPSSVHKKCVLLEEVGHYATSMGNILDQSDANNRRQERLARGWAFDRLIGLDDIVRAYERHCEDLSDMAEYLEVTEEDEQ